MKFIKLIKGSDLTKLEDAINDAIEVASKEGCYLVNCQVSMASHERITHLYLATLTFDNE